ncbi:MAG: tRNA lysidine(34) synthetase TilS [Pseudomonadota bacterium]
MRPLGPFERAPEIAVAVSGGSDSLALALLAAGWAGARGGRAIALTVDHGLRPDASAEAQQVKRWLALRGMAQVTLRWRGPKPETGLQAAARAARYALLADWCRRHAVLHLLLAHQADDLAETFLIRLAHGSGLDGLAAMPAIAELEGVRLLRPLLGVPRARLAATLMARRQPWFEDPSNANPTFERARLRAALPQLELAGIRSQTAAATARALGRARARFDDDVASLLARLRLEPEGWARVPAALLAEAPRPLALKALARLLMTIGGRDYPAGGESLERLLDWIAKGGSRGRTLGGCRLLRRRAELLVLSEMADPRIAHVGARPGRWIWNQRFLVTVTGSARRGWSLAPLGEAGLGALAAALGEKEARPRQIAGPVAAGLPALRDARGRLVAAPLLGLRQPRAAAGPRLAEIRWQPRQPLVTARFAVV